MVIPSIDIMNGKAVQLRGGEELVIEKDNPLELAREFDRYGEIAVIDLDAAMGKGDNLELIKEICKIAECRVGGGIRSVEKAKLLASYGAKKIIVSSKVFEGGRINFEFLKGLNEAIGWYKTMIAIDVRGDEIYTKGWKEPTGLNVYETAAKLERFASEYLFTDIDREGSLEGLNFEKIEKLRNSTKARITVAGGVRDLNDLMELKKYDVDAQVGMAIYTGKIDLKTAFIELLNWKTELLPTITQDESGQVLTLAYSNKESLKKAFETGKMWYFSRSRNKLWMKGETSGNFQFLKRMRADCDRDTILATVKQKGVACHLGSYSCFGERRFSLYELYEIIKERFENPKPGSYTATLDDKKVREKLFEEVNEVIEARGKDEVIWEAADVLYFLTVLLAREGVTIDDVLWELRRRKWK